MSPTPKVSNPSNIETNPLPHAAEQAERCRRLSKSTFDRKTAEMLDRMAADYERQARGDLS